MRCIVLLLVVLLGCPHDVHTRYPSAPDAPTGTLVLLLAQPAANVAVAIDGLLVVEQARTRKLIVDGVPVGGHDVVIAANGGDKAVRVWIDDANPTTVPIGVPESSPGLWQGLLGTLISIVAYAMLR